MKKIYVLGFTIIYKAPKMYEMGDIFIGKGKFCFYRRVPNYPQRFKNIFLSYREEVDCDGYSITITDKLTHGKIYHFYGWNFSRVGGGYGSESKWFDIQY